jgi:putative ABC transport system permease protein
MNLLAITRLAVGRILASRVRSFLTMLGVIIGVASLVALTSIVSGATSGINASLSDLGATQITVQGGDGTALTDADATAVAGVPGVARTSTQVSGRGTAATGSTEKTISLTGVSTGYAAIAAPDVAVGTFLPDWAGADASRTVVLSADGADDLGLGADAVGTQLRIDGSDFTLVGILDDGNGFGVSGAAYVPLETARSLFARSPYVSVITVQTVEGGTVDAVQTQVDALLRARYSLGADDDARFTVTNQSALLSTFQTIQTTLSLLLGGIASISLVVGGIGIMNIMLVSVRERTGEIGVRRAIGARRAQILTQFVIEAVVLSVVGGILGLGVGLGVSAIAAQIGGWAFTVSVSTVALAVGFSALVGVVFGAWPARTASRLQPVDALRFE